MVRFTADEMYALAEEIETRGNQFYTAASERVADPETRAILQELARWENEHFRFFHELREQLPPEASRKENVEETGEDHAAYLQAMVHDRVFPADVNAAFAAMPDTNAISILEYALQREKDVIVFFLTMRDLIPRHWGREQLDAILTEEARHVRIITQQIGKRMGQS